MKIKNGQIAMTNNIINKFINDDDMPSDISYAFFRVRKIIENNIEYQIEYQAKLIKKYNGHNTEDGLVTFSSDDDRNSYDRAIADFANSEVDLESFEKIPFRNDGRCKLSIGELIILEAFFEYQ